MDRHVQVVDIAARSVYDCSIANSCAADPDAHIANGHSNIPFASRDWNCLTCDDCRIICQVDGTLSCPSWVSVWSCVTKQKQVTK